MQVTHRDEKEKMKSFILVSMVILLQSRNAESCTGQSFGPSEQEGLTELDNLNGFGTIGSPDVYKINCCGVLKRWKILPLKAGVIDFHVWRPSGGGQFRLINRNRHEVADSDVGHIRLISLPKSIRISVEPDDLIGWYQPDEAVIAYGSGPAMGYLMKPMPDPYKSGSPDWSNSVEVNEGRTYAVQAIGEENSPPSFVESQQFLNMSNHFGPGSQVFNIEVTDDDKNDIDYLEISMETQNQYFDVSQETRQLVVKETPPIGTHTVYLRVTDHCNATASGTININVYDAPHTTTPVPTHGPEIQLGGPAQMNRLDPVPGDGRHLWVIGVILALAIVATAISIVIFLGRKGVLPIGASKTNPSAARKISRHNDVKARKTSQQTANKERKPSVTKEKKPPQPQPTQDEKPKPTPDEKPKPTPDEKPKPTPDEKPKPTPDEKPKPTPDEKPQPIPEEKSQPTPEEKPQPIPEEKSQPTPEEKPQPTQDEKIIV